MGKSVVSIVGCPAYDGEALKEKILGAVNLAGIDLKSLAGLKVALKPNLLTSAKAGQGVVTNPDFFRAVAELVKDFGGSCVVVESPSVQSLGAVMKRTGYLDIVHSLGIEIADENAVAAVHYDAAKRYKTIEVIKRILDVDAVVNLPKCKTHGLTYFTGAVKNLFGLMPGMRKARMHLKAPGALDFSEFLLDFYGALLRGLPNRPRFIHIMDAIVALEGEGPGPSGKPKHLGAILAGGDALAVDLAAARTAGLDENKVLTLKLGYRSGLGIMSPKDLTITGDYTPVPGATAMRPAGSSFLDRSARWPAAFRTLKNLLVEKPEPVEGPCTLCYRCRTICPAEAISERAGKAKVPRYEYGECIRCFCCMEVCPEGAIRKKHGPLQWLLPG